MNIREATIEAMEVLGEAASRLGEMPGLGPVGWGFKGAGSALKTISRVMQERDDTIEEILGRIKAPRSLKMPWNKPPEPVDAELVDEKTPAERPSKKDP